MMIMDFIQICNSSESSVLPMTVQEKVYSKPFYSANNLLYIVCFSYRKYCEFLSQCFT